MSFTPTSILARLDELKKWQEQQQERLLQQHHSRIKAVDKDEIVVKKSEISRDTLGTESHNLVTPKRSVFWSDQAPNEQVKSFRTELEEKLSSEIGNNTSKPKVITKRPFLRKGQGLARFKMSLSDQQIHKLKNKGREVAKSDIQLNITPLKKPLVTIETVNNCLNSENQNENKSEVTNSVVSARKNIVDQINLYCREKKQQENEECNENNKHPKNPDKVIDSDLTLYEKALERELKIYEALEEKAMNSSFSSTNSSVMRLLSSTPSKTIKRNISVQLQQNFELNQNDLISFAEDDVEVIKNVERMPPFIKTEEESSILDNKDMSIKSDDVRNLLKKFLPSIQQNNPKQYFEENLYNDFPSDYYGDEEIKVESENDEKDTTLNDMNCKNCFKNLMEQKKFVNVGVMTENFDRVTEKDLEKKIQDLNEEIEKFRSENNKIAKIKREIELEQLSFQKEHREKRKNLEEERENLLQQIEEEKRKLAKEKMVFERYVKDSQNKPSRKEREEITLLKGDIANLKETLNLKETKNGMTQARLRNQIKRLEKINLEYKEQIEILQKQNGRMQAAQKINNKPTDTKILHEINRNISRLTVNNNKKVKCKSFSNNNSDLSDDSCKQRKIKKRTKSLNELDKIKSKSRSKSTSNCSYSDEESDDSMKDLGSRKKRNRVNFEDQKENLSDLKDNVTKEFEDIERQYERLFGNCESLNRAKQISNLDDSRKASDRKERLLADGTKEIIYSNGNIKTISNDGNLITINYYNGDLKQTDKSIGVVKYYYKENKIWHTTYPDGMELLEFPNGQVEKRFKNGTNEIKYEDGTIRTVDGKGTEKITYKDGSTVTINSKGEKIIELPTGEKEIHTNEHKKRIYPDGTIKVVFADGSQETRYSNGRIRIKDKHGNLIMDSIEGKTV